MIITGYKRFVGSYLEDKYLVFVLANSIEKDLAEFDFLFYNTETGEIADPEYSDFCQYSNRTITATSSTSSEIELVYYPTINEVVPFDFPYSEYYDGLETQVNPCTFNNNTSTITLVVPEGATMMLVSIGTVSDYISVNVNGVENSALPNRLCQTYTGEYPWEIDVVAGDEITIDATSVCYGDYVANGSVQFY